MLTISCGPKKYSLPHVSYPLKETTGYLQCVYIVGKHHVISCRWQQHTKKVLSYSAGVVDFAIGLVTFVLCLPEGQVLFMVKSQITEGLK